MRSTFTSISRIAERRAWPLSLFAVLAIVAAVYAPTIDDYFGGDDFMVLGPVRAMAPWELIWKSFLFRDGIPYWRPLVSPVYALEVHWFGLRPWPYHAVAIALHLLNVALLAGVARVLTGRRWMALGAALLFGIHPAKSTTVPMISSTVELVGMAWYLLTVLCCSRFAREGGRRWYWFGLLAFALGLLTKESVASAAGVVSVLFATLWLPYVAATAGRRRAVGRLTVLVLPYWLLVAPYAAITYLTNREDPTGYAKVMYFIGPHIGQNMWWFLARLAAPLEFGRGPHVSAIGHLGAAVLVVAGAWTLLHGAGAARFLVLWTLIALTPLALWRPEYLVGRFTYMATAPYAILLALVGVRLIETCSTVLPRRAPRWALAMTVVVVATTACSPLTIEQSRDRTREGDTYYVLVSTLRRDYPEPPQSNQIVLINGVWAGAFHAVFLESVADTLYGPGRVRIINTTGDPPASLPTGALRLSYENGALHEIPADGASK